MKTHTYNLPFRVTSCFVALAFTLTVLTPPSQSHAQTAFTPSGVEGLNLPPVGQMVTLSPAFAPAVIKGVKIFPDNPLRFDFIVDTGDSELDGGALQAESEKLIKYFLASLTVPEEDLWVNLSPYEKDRIIPNAFGQTEMGRDLLAQDYILKQITASLMYPEDELGEEFWDRIYEKAYKEYGTTEIPVNTFNKVWIVPEKAVVYENAETNTAFVVESRLKVMLEEDYVAAQHNPVGAGLASARNEETNEGGGKPLPYNNSNNISTEIIREILIPAIEKEVNEGENFAQLRQIYHSMILATWFKRNLKESVLGKIYVDRNKTAGVDVADKDINHKIYNQYLEAFKKGVYNYIREDYDPNTQEIIPRKYFSGGMVMGFASSPIQYVPKMPGSVLTDGEANVVVKMELNPIARGAPPGSIPPGMSTEQEFIRTDSGLFLSRRRAIEPVQSEIVTQAVENGWDKGPEGLMVPADEEHTRLKLATAEETSLLKLGAGKGFIEIEGMDAKGVEKAFKAVSGNVGWANMSTSTRLTGLLERYLGNYFSEIQQSGVNRIIKDISVSRGSGDKDLLNDVVDKLEYLLHPDVFKIIVDSDRGPEVLDFLSKAWKKAGVSQSVSARHRRVELLINLLEGGGLQGKCSAENQRFNSIYGCSNFWRRRLTARKE